MGLFCTGRGGAARYSLSLASMVPATVFVFDSGEQIAGGGLETLGAGEQPLRFGELIDQEPLMDVARAVIGAEIL